MVDAVVVAELVIRGREEGHVEVERPVLAFEELRVRDLDKGAAVLFADDCAVDLGEVKFGGDELSHGESFSWVARPCRWRR